ncbi:MAG: hypothetical protein JO100_19215 [Pseudonocardia sp.]|nr:hypothetical protein [Pseudonocardia sp.]
MTSSSAIFRSLRAAAFAAVCVALASTAHAIASGRPVALTTLGAGFGIVFVAALAAGQRERSQRAITAGVLAGQAGLHGLFHFACCPCHHTAAMPHMAMSTPPMSPSGHDPLFLGKPPHDGGFAMLSAHLIAGLVTGWWLRRGEAAAWRLLRRVESATFAALCSVVAKLAGIVDYLDELRPVCRCAALSGESGTTRTERIVRCVPRRGPPWLSRPH